MNLAVSNIAWDASVDEAMYQNLRNLGYKGLEIAPSRIFPHQPYDNLLGAALWQKNLREKYSLTVPSMQSIWYGRSEKLFGSEEEMAALFNYTKKAIDFANVIFCRNLVFGCPKNRILQKPEDYKLGIEFFVKIADYGESVGAFIGLEANPAIYGTNYINTTDDALKLLREVDKAYFRLNLDVGTMIANEENPEILAGNVALISHVHISEPYLKPIKKRQIHKELAELLYSERYDGFVSVEMGKVDDVTEICRVLEYVRGIFG